MSFSFGINNISKGNNTYKDKPAGGALPLFYKDKVPAFHPAHTSKNKKRILMLLKGFMLSLVLYAVYHLASNGGQFMFDFSGQSKWERAQSEVRQAMLDSWHTYEKYGWGYDVYHPIKQEGEIMGPKPLGWMIVDSLDTLMIMDCPEEVSRARDWIKNDLDYTFDYNVNTFETTIRMLGGLLSAYHFSNDDVYLDKAVQLANALHGAYDSPSGIPYSSVNLKSGKGIKNHVDNGASSTAEAATVQLEMKYLSKLTGEILWWNLAEKVMQVLESNKPQDGLVPIYVNPDTGKYQGHLIRLGSRGDSYYEYLLKQYLQTNKQELVYWDMYRESVEGVKKHLVSDSYPSGLTFIGELDNGIGGKLSTKMDHLVCFYGGLLALGATGGLTLNEAQSLKSWNEEREADFKLGEELTYTCYKMYHDVSPTGLSPEIVVFNEDTSKSKDFIIKPLDRHNLQRPETVESLFYLYRLTGDVKYREMGYEIFQNFIKHTKVVNSEGEVSFSSLSDVTSFDSNGLPKFKDNTESFWWAETLKYLYLLFDDTNKIPLTDYVFNTEAHPFPRFDTNDYFKTGWRRKIDENEKAQMRESKVIDKSNLPEAQPVDKSADQEAKEIIEEIAG
ncbi:mannosyl-oligosaccharide 1,2-alpha-mannosidase [Candida albicans SC5314]|uniref:alpha-1,2-Mannosidase n=1 Tax=Candida albicans P78048 TaxID=1094989 RepID=A0AB34PZ64_CANAX|nr:mannosyl-oligosaccharide 1,2-alpha-mannosidase [Candida albicans P37005]KGR21402.1 mannosyl-oligosaccharide 1,2-alpha-mannosidase [Candida albicans P78048]KGR23427.1 mannosyl-oligosaccharide 1,2-alpha-mannosidase [Candida albicans P37037]KHC83150.1 mannosyl-oligosaccharide 1,2-alpha-mannosidase [Candida albicans SC5314]